MFQLLRYPLLILLNTILLLIYLICEFIFMIFGSSTLVNNSQSYNFPERLYFYILYGVISSPLIIVGLIRGLYKMWCKDGLNTNFLTISISIFRFVSFIWGTISLVRIYKNNLINDYKQEYSDVFGGFINYYVISCFIIFLGIVNFIIKWAKDYKKNKVRDIEYKLISKEDQENNTNVEILL